jgi:hypothetical protein
MQESCCPSESDYKFDESSISKQYGPNGKEHTTASRRRICEPTKNWVMNVEHFIIDKLIINIILVQLLDQSSRERCLADHEELLRK